MPFAQRLFPRSNLRGPIAQSRNAAGKIGTEERGRLLMINARKERHRAVEVADPDIGGAGVEVEGAFFVDLGWGVRWGKDLDADLGRASECEGSLEQLWPATVEPHEVNGFDTVSGGKRAFGESTTVGKEGLQQVGDTLGTDELLLMSAHAFMNLGSARPRPAETAIRVLCMLVLSLKRIEESPNRKGRCLPCGGHAFSYR